jgi:hypothetical protein
MNLANTEFSGIMIVGVINKKGNFVGASKVIGSVINYTLTGKDINIKILLDANKRSMTIYTANKPEGEVFTDLPKDGVFYPAIQNKTQKVSNNAKLLVEYKFELAIPKDKSTIMLMDEEELNEDILGGAADKDRRKTLDFIGNR